MMMPNIDTERLTLRVPTLADFDDSKAMWGDPEVVRHIGGVPFTEEECWARLHRYVGHWALLGCGMWVLREKETGSFIGEAGFLEVKRAIVPPFDAPEVGWALARAAHGKGYATEAVRAVLTWGEAHFGTTRFACMIDPGNHASERVAEKVGFRAATLTAYKGSPVVIYRRS
jgi:RimJ/RimL family protein N-acetyltransferase